MSDNQADDVIGAMNKAGRIFQNPRIWVFWGNDNPTQRKVARWIALSIAAVLGAGFVATCTSRAKNEMMRMPDRAKEFSASLKAKSAKQADEAAEQASWEGQTWEAFLPAAEADFMTLMAKKPGLTRDGPPLMTQAAAEKVWQDLSAAMSESSPEPTYQKVSYVDPTGQRPSITFHFVTAANVAASVFDSSEYDRRVLNEPIKRPIDKMSYFGRGFDNFYMNFDRSADDRPEDLVKPYVPLYLCVDVTDDGRGNKLTYPKTDDGSIFRRAGSAFDAVSNGYLNKRPAFDVDVTVSQGASVYCENHVNYFLSDRKEDARSYREARAGGMPFITPEFFSDARKLHLQERDAYDAALAAKEATEKKAKPVIGAKPK